MAKAAKRLRLDQLVFDRGLASSRTRAQSLIMAGEVFSDGRRLDKAGTLVAQDLALEIKTQGHGWVSRGALKLIHGLDHFKIDPKGTIAIDVGASTGGFSEVLLARGAGRVYAVDVGHGQLDWKLRNDERVVVLERTNARYLTGQHIDEPVGMVVCDASFISLKKVLPAALDLCNDDAKCVALIKPQFEAGRAEVGKGGVVRDPAVHQRVCEEIAEWIALVGWDVIGVCESPVKGPKGNIEFLIGAKKILK